MIIDMRKAILLLPVYVALMVGADLLFNSGDLNTRNDLPLWLIIGFTLVTVLVFLLVAWYLVQRSRGKVPPKRERVYMAFLVALVISSLIDDGLKALTKLVFHSMSIWISIPCYVLSYAILLGVVVIVVNRVTTNPSMPVHSVERPRRQASD